jgi:hypothetical protein
LRRACIIPSEIIAKIPRGNHIPGLWKTMPMNQQTANAAIGVGARGLNLVIFKAYLCSPMIATSIDPNSLFTFFTFQRLMVMRGSW